MENNRAIQHLFSRAGFGMSPGEWQKWQQAAASSAVDHLFEMAGNAVLLPEPAWVKEDLMGLEREKIEELLKEGRQQVIQLASDWLHRMADPGQPALLEKMTLFWHGHFACESKTGLVAVKQINTLRTHALGNFKTLVLAIARDAGMIRYLNNQQNRKQKPNENFARELMELFTIGRGHYSEQDVKEAARAFTGWSSDPQGNFVFRERAHDTGSKTFMGRTGNFDGSDVIEILLERPETAQFITRKILRFFVTENPAADQINHFSNLFFRSGYDIKALMRAIFESDWFYAPEQMGRQIKSPVVLLAGMLRAVNGAISDSRQSLFVMRSLGQTLFRPPNVAGWPSGKNWINNASLQLRLNLAAGLLSQAELDLNAPKDLEAEKGEAIARRLQADVDLQPLSKATENMSPEARWQYLQNYLLQGRTVDWPEASTASLQHQLIAIMSLPEYQVC